MDNNFQLTLTKEMSLNIHTGTSAVHISGDDIDVPFISMAGTEAINISTHFIEIKESDKLNLRLLPEKEKGESSNYVVHIPQTWNQNMVVETTTGRIKVTRISGTVKIQTTGGQVVLESITGDIQANAANASIEGLKLAGKADLSSSNGKIMIKESKLSGGTLKTNEGEIILQVIPGESGNLNITGNGPVKLAIAPDSNYLIRVQTKEKLENHLENCSVVTENEITTIQKGDAKFIIFIINFKGGVQLMDYNDLNRDWTKKDFFNSDNFKIPDPVEFFKDVFSRDYSKDIPNILKGLSDLGSNFTKFGDDVSKKMNEFQDTASKNEVKLVLEMLKDGKITIDEAEKLINALKKR